MSRRPAILLAVGSLLLILVGAVVYLLRPVPVIQLAPEEPAPAARESSPTRVESTPSDTRVAPVAPAPAAPAAPPEDLRAEGARRGWQLPFGKGWWTDELVNPAGVEPDSAALATLQARLVALGDQLNALRLRRKQRLDAYCQERIAAGLAVADPQGVEPLPEGKEHVIVKTHTPQEPTRYWRVDVGPGDDAELDQLEKRLADAWCEAVLELRRLLVK